MNEKIVILGNGFDLRHFLPTKYDHLITILTVVENLDFSNFEEVNFNILFGNSFKEKEENKWFYQEICKHYNTNEILFKKDSLISIQKRLKNNNWFKYLKTVEDSKIETWIDFETEIERVLKIMLNYFENFNNTSLQKPKYGNLDRGNCFHSPNYEYENYFSNRLQFRILENFGLYEHDENYGLNIVNDKFALNIDDEIQYFKEKDFFDAIYISLEEFTGIFNDYIDHIVNAFYPKFKEDKKENFIIFNNKKLFKTVTKIYSFNYTQTYFKFYWDISNAAIQSYEYELEHIHGKSIEKWDLDLEKLQIVLGVSEIDKNLKNHKLFQFTKYFQKLHKDTDYLFLKNYFDAMKFNSRRSILNFYFWGHSLDISDDQYIKEIFTYLEDERSTIKIFFHSISGKADQLKNLLNIIDKNIIENLMKDKRLTFIHSSPENLFAELS